MWYDDATPCLLGSIGNEASAVIVKGPGYTMPYSFHTQIGFRSGQCRQTAQP